MKLITIEEYIETYYSHQSRPSRRTVWRWIREGKFPLVTQKMGKRIYIKTDSTRTGNPLVDRIIFNG